MKGKLFIFIVIIIVITGIYFAVKKPSVEAPVIQDQAQSSSSANSVSSVMEEMSNEDMMNHEQSSNGEKISKKHIVNYTDKGFNPSSLEIKAGETVQFVNQSGGGMWTASGPHPSHTAYPEFDAKKNIPSGGTYEFTFTKIGEWKYHNHAKAGMFGTIIVK